MPVLEETSKGKISHHIPHRRNRLGATATLSKKVKKLSKLVLRQLGKSWSCSNAFVSGAGGLRFESWADEI